MNNMTNFQHSIIAPSNGTQSTAHIEITGTDVQDQWSTCSIRPYPAESDDHFIWRMDLLKSKLGGSMSLHIQEPDGSGTTIYAIVQKA
jgi:hypothetical protein